MIMMIMIEMIIIKEILEVGFLLLIGYNILTQLEQNFPEEISIRNIGVYIYNLLTGILYCNKCLSFWLSFILTGNFLLSATIAYSILLVQKLIEWDERRGIMGDGE